MRKSNLPEQLVLAYQKAIYSVDSEPPVRFRIDGVPYLKDLLNIKTASSAAFITAYNPLGEELSEESNQKRHKELLAFIKTSSFAYLTGRGCDESGSWTPEESILIFNISLQKAKILGNRFEQNAIVWISHDGIAKLIVLR